MISPQDSSRTRWGDKPYNSLNYYLREQFGEKVFRLSLHGGLSCPNRDGTLGTRGCIFCSRGGSGDFAASPELSITDQIDEARALVSKKNSCRKFVAYFQAYTNTYGPVSYLRRIFFEAVGHPDIAALSIATRPDCLSPEILDLLQELNEKKTVWIELGLQTIHDETRSLIRSGFTLDCFRDAFMQLHSANIPVIVHVILGLPEETREMMLQTVSYLSGLGIDGIKLQLLHILSDTDLAGYYEKNPFTLFTREEYCRLVVECLELLDPRIVIHRLTGDGPRNLLIGPMWSTDKKQVLNQIHKIMRMHNSYQGKRFVPQ